MSHAASKAKNVETDNETRKKGRNAERVTYKNVNSGFEYAAAMKFNK
jgi:hypothetical protein